MNKHEVSRSCRFGLTDDGRIVTVTTIHDEFAAKLGYQLADVVITCNPESPVNPADITRGTTRQFSVSRCNADVAVDLLTALKELSHRELWTGDADCIRSPLGSSSWYELKDVVDIISRHLHHPKEES